MLLIVHLLLITGFKTTGIFPVDETKYKISRLDSIKLKSYKKWRNSGSKVDSDGSPKLINEEEDLNVAVNNVCQEENPSLHSAVVSSVSFSRFPAKHISPRKLSFSVRSFQESFSDNSSVNQEEPSCSTPRENELLKPDEILKLLEKNAPPGYKYALTLVPLETDNLEKVLKRRMSTNITYR